MNLIGCAQNLPVRYCVPSWYVVGRILPFVGKILHNFVKFSFCKCA